MLTLPSLPLMMTKLTLLTSFNPEAVLSQQQLIRWIGRMSQRIRSSQSIVF